MGIAVPTSATIYCTNVQERSQAIDYLQKAGYRECLHGIGNPAGMLLILFPDQSYMLDNEPDGSELVPASKLIAAN